MPVSFSNSVELEILQVGEKLNEPISEISSTFVNPPVFSWEKRLPSLYGVDAPAHLKPSDI